MSIDICWRVGKVKTGENIWVLGQKSVLMLPKICTRIKPTPRSATNWPVATNFIATLQWFCGIRALGNFSHSGFKSTVCCRPFRWLLLHSSQALLWLNCYVFTLTHSRYSIKMQWAGGNFSNLNPIILISPVQCAVLYYFFTLSWYHFVEDNTEFQWGHTHIQNVW